MPAPVDSGDTSPLDLTADPEESGSSSADDALARGPGMFAESPGSRPVEFQIHRFAEGIIRFYRARAILSRGSRDELTGLAWSYLEHLEPAQVPGIARPAFFDLAYFMQLQLRQDSFDHAGFRRRVLDVTVIIDGFLDDILLRAGS